MELLNFNSNIDDLIDKNCEEFNINRTQLFAKTRKPHIIKARRKVYYILHTEHGLKLEQIASMFNKTRLTIFHSIKEYKRLDKTKNVKNVENKEKLKDSFITILKKEKELLNKRINKIEDLIKLYNDLIP